MDLWQPMLREMLSDRPLVMRVRTAAETLELKMRIRMGKDGKQILILHLHFLG